MAEKSERCVDWNRSEPVVNIIEKILARAFNREQVRPEEIVEARINSAMVHDITGPLAVESWKMKRAHL